MKKLIMMMLFLATVSINCFALSETAIILHHGDSVKVFEGPSQLTTVLNEAVDNDVIYLGKGAYDGFQITKKVRIIGSGNDQTQINGDISIDIESTQEEPAIYTEPILEGIYIPSAAIYLYQYTQGVTVRKCNVNTISLKTGTHTGLTLDRCSVQNFTYSQDMRDGSIINSKINYFENDGTNLDDFSIYNSYIYEIHYCRNFMGSMINSIICTKYYDKYDYSNRFQNGNFINTLYYSANLSFDSTAIQKDCYQEEGENYHYTPEELRELGYLGTDGTVVGCYGGATPFTLEMSVPAVDEARSKIEVDNAKKVLNVSLILTSAPEEPKEDSSTEE